MTIQLLSVNVGSLSKLPGTRSRTGIAKQSVSGPVTLGLLGLEGDAIGNHTHHGGHDQAVYLYSAADYVWWSEQLGEPCPPGRFGENLTLDAWWETPRIGDQIRVGDVVLELTAPRIPCNTLATFMGRRGFEKAFTEAQRPGAYARVLATGVLSAGMTGSVTPAAATNASVVDVAVLWSDRAPPADRLAAALRSPLASRARVKLAGRIPKGA